MVSNSTANQKTETQAAETKRIEQPVLATRVMQIEEAKAFFADYARELASQNRRSLSSFLADPIIQVNEGKITFTVGSKNVAKDIEDETMKIIRVASEKGWIISEIVTAVDAVKVSDYQVFTPKQQYDVLAKDYPVLKDFEARFNLNFDA